MKETINKVAKDISQDLLKENIIDENVIAIKIKNAINILLDKNKNVTGIDYIRMQNRLRKQNQELKRKTIERDFWKDIAKIYIGYNINEYYNRLDLLINKNK
jgi:hypothetical protein